MQNGVVKWFSTEKGYGFISGSGKDYFVHFKDINGSGFKQLNQGDKVSFEPNSSPKGLIALNVMVKQELYE